MELNKYLELVDVLEKEGLETKDPIINMNQVSFVVCIKILSTQYQSWLTLEVDTL